MLLGRVVVEVLARAAGVAAGHPRLGARAGELGLHPHLAARRAEAERGPVEAAVALHLGALAGEDPGALGDVLGGDVAQRRRLADVQLDHRVEQRVGLVAGRAAVLPDLGLGALLEHDQGAPVDDAPPLVERQLDLDRLGDLDSGGHVDEHAVAPARLVAGDEGVLDPAPASRVARAVSSRMGIDRLGERQHGRSLGALEIEALTEAAS